MGMAPFDLAMHLGEIDDAKKALNLPASILALVVLEIEIALAPSPIFGVLSVGGYTTSVVGLVLDFSTGFVLSGVSVGASSIALVIDKFTRNRRRQRLVIYQRELAWYEQQQDQLRYAVDLIEIVRQKRGL